MFVQRLLKRDRARAFEAAVGGAFGEVGAVERDIVLAEGLSGDDLLVDVGCGAGRLAVQLKDRTALRYLGVDVAPDLLRHAEAACARPDWRFVAVDQTRIPCKDGDASMCVAFSLFTHLSEATCLDYLAEMRRVLRPSGVAVFSFFDPEIDAHRRLIEPGSARSFLKRVAYARNVGFPQDRIAAWAEQKGFKVRRIESPSALGQSLAVFERQASEAAEFG